MVNIHRNILPIHQGAPAITISTLQARIVASSLSTWLVLPTPLTATPIPGLACDQPCLCTRSTLWDALEMCHWKVLLGLLLTFPQGSVIQLLQLSGVRHGILQKPSASVEIWPKSFHKNSVIFDIFGTTNSVIFDVFGTTNCVILSFLGILDQLKIQDSVAIHV